MNAYDHVVGSLRLREDGRWLVRDDGARVRLNLSDDGGEMILHEIQAAPKGSGLGTSVVDALGDHAEDAGKALVIEDVRNAAFFDRFEWLTQGDEGEYVYSPMLAREADVQSEDE